MLLFLKKFYIFLPDDTGSEKLPKNQRVITKALLLKVGSEIVIPILYCSYRWSDFFSESPLH